MSVSTDSLTAEIVRQFSRQSRARSRKGAIVDFDFDKKIQERLLRVEATEMDPLEKLFDSMDLRRESSLLSFDNNLANRKSKKGQKNCPSNNKIYTLQSQPLDPIAKRRLNSDSNSRSSSKISRKSTEELDQLHLLQSYERSIGQAYEGFTGRFVNKKKREDLRKMKRLSNIFSSKADTKSGRATENVIDHEKFIEQYVNGGLLQSENKDRGIALQPNSCSKEVKKTYGVKMLKDDGKDSSRAREGSFVEYVKEKKKNANVKGKANIEGHFIAPTGKNVKKSKDEKEKPKTSTYFDHQPELGKDDYKSFRAFRRARNSDIYTLNEFTSAQVDKQSGNGSQGGKKVLKGPKRIQKENTCNNEQKEHSSGQRHRAKKFLGSVHNVKEIQKHFSENQKKFVESQKRYQKRSCFTFTQESKHLNPNYSNPVDSISGISSKEKKKDVPKSKRRSKQNLTIMDACNTMKKHKGLLANGNSSKSLKVNVSQGNNAIHVPSQNGIEKKSKRPVQLNASFYSSIKN
eukprot:Nk52_evm11s223 gene=Nk52_evmTU11s223